uniref:Uncharacterized protein n=1 Tax=Oryza nivara TaxID=4536 RepID=A0A0E0ILC1_ORYNI
MLLSAPSMPRLPTRPALLILLLELSNPQLKEVQFFPKPAVLLATLPVLLLAELMVVLYKYTTTAKSDNIYTRGQSKDEEKQHKINNGQII